MKRKLLVLAMVLALCFVCTAVLVACNNDGNGNGGGGGGNDTCQHQWSNWQTTTEASCGKAGEKQRSCSLCQQVQKETIAALTHNYEDGFCSHCGAFDESNSSFVDGEEFEYVRVSANGTLNWSRLKIATKYTLDVTFPDGSKQTFTLDKKQGAQKLDELVSGKPFPAGKSNMKLTAYKLEEWEVDGQKFEDELPISANADQFLVTKLNGAFQLDRLSFADDYIRLNGFYATPRQIDGDVSYLLEAKLPENSTNAYITYSRSAINNMVKAQSGYTLHFYRSNDDMLAGENEIFKSSFGGELISAHTGSYGSLYVAVTDAQGDIKQTYSLKFRTLVPVTYNFHKATVGELEGYRKETYTTMEHSIVAYEGDIISADVMFDGVQNLFARDKKFNVVSTSQDMLVSLDNCQMQSNDLSAVAHFYFYENKQLVEADCAQYATYANDFTLSLWQSATETDLDYWTMSYKTYLGKMQDIIIPATIADMPVVSFSVSGNAPTSVTVQGGYVGSITQGAFRDCPNLVTINLPDTIPSASFGNWIVSGTYNSELQINCEFSSSHVASDNYRWNYVSGKTYTHTTNYNKVGITSSIVVDGVVVNTASGTGVVTGVTDSFNGTIPSSVNFVGKTYNVTSIESGALDGQTTVHVPQHVTQFAPSASITTITVDANNTAFFAQDNVLYNKDCTQILFVPATLTGNVTIAEGITTLGTQFAGKGITSLTLPATLAELQANALSNCASLQTVVFAENGALTTIGANAFSGCAALQSIALPQAIETIGQGAFSGCAGLQSVELPSALKTIGANAFSGCAQLTSVVVPNGVTAIGASAFYGCNSLQSITLPFAGATADGTVDTNFGYVFGGNSSVPSTITEIKIMGGVAIASGSFGNCTALTSITLPFVGASLGGTENTHFGYVFYSGTNANNMIPSTLEKVTIIGGGAIPAYAFNVCANIIEVYIESGIKSIQEYAFQKCTNLTKIELGDEIENIEKYAFYNCSQLTHMALSSNLKSLDMTALAGCINLDYNEHKNILYLGSELKPYMVLIKVKDATSTNYQLHDDTKMICDSAFAGCVNLQEVTLPTNITTVGTGVFSGCTSLKKINIASLSNWFNITFGGTVFENGNSNTWWSEGTGLYYNGELLKDIVVPDGTEKIAANIFAGCRHINSISIAESVEEIGEYAFFEAYDLTDVIFRGNSSLSEIGDYAFSDSGIRSITIPASVKRIGMHAFSKLDHGGRISSVLFEDNSQLEVLGSSAFSDCSNLENIILPEGIQVIEQFVFYNCDSLIEIAIPSSVKHIKTNAFANCASLENIHFAANTRIERIDINAFANCNRLIYYTYDNAKYLDKDYTVLVSANNSIQSCEIHENTKLIKAEAFMNETQLMSVSMPDGLAAIGDRAFSDCSSLSSITIPSRVNYMGYNVFYGCTGLTEINYYATTIESNGLSGTFHKAGQRGEGISLVIGANVTQIPDGIFGYKSENYGEATYYAPKIINVVFEKGSGCKSIGDYAFSGCNYMTSINIPQKIVSIGERAFMACLSLKEVLIPQNVTKIGKEAFGYCKSLTKIDFNATEIEVLGTEIFKAAGRNANGIILNVAANVTKIPDRLFWIQNIGSANTYSPKITKVVFADNSACEYIGFASFNYCVSLTEVVFGENSQLKNIARYAFSECNNLNSISISNTVEFIDQDAFGGCTNLQTIEYGGTTKQWNAINKTYGWIYSSENYTIICTDGTIDKNGTVTYN